MQFKALNRRLLLALLALGLSAGAMAQDEAASAPADKQERAWPGTVGVSGDAGYYTYGMKEADERFHDQSNTSFSGGMGYGAGVKVYLTQALAAKAGIDYLFASRPSTRVVRGITYNTRVDMPATLIFLGGEFTMIPLGPLNLKLIGGYTLVNIYNGKEQASDATSLDMGSITGSGSGFQAGAGLEVFLSRFFSIEADLCYNRARIDGATFAGAPSDPSASSSNGAVDYSGMVGKAAFTLYLN